MITDKQVETLDNVVYNPQTNTTEVGGHMDVDGTLKCAGGEEVITDIQAVVDEGKPQLNLKQGNTIVNVCDLSGVMGGINEVLEVEHRTPDGTSIMEGVFSCYLLNKRIYRISQCIFNFMDEEGNTYLTNGKLYSLTENPLFKKYGLSSTLEDPAFRTGFDSNATIPMTSEMATQWIATEPESFRIYYPAVDDTAACYGISKITVRSTSTITGGAVFVAYEYNEDTGAFERTGTETYDNFNVNNCYFILWITGTEPVMLEY